MTGQGRAPQVHRLTSRPGGGRRLWVGRLGILGLGMVAFILLAGGCSGSGAQAKGELAPDFSIPSTEGTFTLSEQKGNLVFLFFSSPE
ncbi:MAG: hypothetical protein HYX93_07280 [Chloroflexi bacterium]|nr:hypothetical protein [Chloroflexota bacterium]